MAEQNTYELFRRGSELLDRGDHHAALVQLAEVHRREPDKDSVREAYGRALFSTQHFAEAEVEFRAIAEHDPTNHYALFCRGRCLQQLGKHAEARAPLRKHCISRPIATTTSAICSRACAASTLPECGREPAITGAARC